MADLYRDQRKSYANIRCESIVCDGYIAGERESAVVQYNAATNTDSGNVGGAGYAPIPINEVVSDPSGIVLTLAANRITLAAGKYRLSCDMSLYNTAVTPTLVRPALRNISTGAIVLSGVNGWMTQSNQPGKALIEGIFEVTNEAHLYEFQTYFSQATNTAWGLKLNLVGEKEVYMSALLEKVA